MATASALRWSAAFAAAVLLAMLLLATRGPRSGPPVAAVTPAASAGAAPAGPVVDSRGGAVAASLAARPPAGQAPIAPLLERFARSSLRDTQVDGVVGFDAAGRVRADAGLRRLFDHFLSLTGEFAPHEIRALLLAHVEATYGAQAGREVEALFARYVGLRAELAGMAPESDLGRRLAQLREARRRWFGQEEAGAMFGLEEAEVAHTLARRSIEQDADLGPTEREAALASLDAARPASQRAAQRDATAAVLAEEQTRQLDALAAGAAAREAERTALWGADAAQRLAALDAERAAWQRRLEDYVVARDRIRADGALDAAGRERALHALRAAAFAPHEQQRIEALEGVGALPGG